MKVSETTIPGVLLIEPQVFADSRGFFLETWRHDRYREQGLPAMFVQDNLSRSERGVLRGLHFQYPQAQGKLIQVLHGAIFDVAVDIRVGSPTFGQWVGMTLTGEQPQQVYIAEGFAHGFCVLSESAVVMYKCTDVYTPQSEGGILWNDPALGIAWPIAAPHLSLKDARLPLLNEIPASRLPSYSATCVTA
jgi:dTDP-4-dehydrorhamnose 3,5-epimerase